MRLSWSACLVTLIVCAISCSTGSLPNPQEPNLYANLWMQSAAEYYAICEQTYALAYDRVAALAEASAGDKTLAVVMDLDETVIDNSGFQAYLYRNRATYSEEVWEAYVRYQSEAPGPRAVPGAPEFISRIEQLGVTVVFISNRSESSRQYTLRTLSRLGIDTGGAEARVLLRTTTSSKAERRQLAANRYEIIAWFGDNLADFAAEFEDGVSVTSGARRQHAEQTRSRWGAEWFVLPNPAYGDYLGVLDEPLAVNLSGPAEL